MSFASSVLVCCLLRILTPLGIGTSTVIDCPSSLCRLLIDIYIHQPCVAVLSTATRCGGDSRDLTCCVHLCYSLARMPDSTVLTLSVLRHDRCESNQEAKLPPVGRHLSLHLSIQKQLCTPARHLTPAIQHAFLSISDLQLP